MVQSRLNMGKPKQIAPTSLQIQTVADLLRVSTRRVRFMVEEGKLAKEEGAGISVASLAAFLATKDAAPDDYEANKARKMKADADLAEIAVEKERGRLLDANRTSRAWEAAVLHARSKLLALPERLGQQVATAPDVTAAKKILAREITDTLNALADCRVDVLLDEVAEPKPPSETDGEESDDNGEEANEE